MKEAPTVAGRHANDADEATREDVGIPENLHEGVDDTQRNSEKTGRKQGPLIAITVALIGAVGAVVAAVIPTVAGNSTNSPAADSRSSIPSASIPASKSVISKSKPSPTGAHQGSGSRTEQEANTGANTFSDPHNASGKGPEITPGKHVFVSCKLNDPSIASVNPGGYWYRIASAPWNNHYYAAANTFLNGDPWGGPYTHPTDLGVNNC
jgi:hypothetical protein